MIQLIHIQPARPMQSGQVESFNGRLQDECLNAIWSRNLADAREKILRRREEYNSERPPSSLDNRTPSSSPKRRDLHFYKDEKIEAGQGEPKIMPRFSER
jgi:transposase InsO family protein